MYVKFNQSVFSKCKLFASALCCCSLLVPVSVCATDDSPNDVVAETSAGYDSGYNVDSSEDVGQEKTVEAIIAGDGDEDVGNNQEGYQIPSLENFSDDGMDNLESDMESSEVVENTEDVLSDSDDESVSLLSEETSSEEISADDSSDADFLAYLEHIDLALQVIASILIIIVLVGLCHYSYKFFRMFF